jgi:protein required for attachment to host cells
MTRKEDPTEHLAAEFAHEVAAAIERGRVEGAFDRLALVAAPRFLGRLRDALPEASLALVVASLDKNLPDAEPETVRASLADIRLV